MLAVYRITHDLAYPELTAADPEEYRERRAEGSWAFTGHEFEGPWMPIALQCPSTKHLPDFWKFENTFISEVHQEQAGALIRTIIRGCGEYYPVSIGGRDGCAIHITYVIDGLDHENSVIDTSAGIANIVSYAFHKERLFETGYTLFKIVETHEREILTLHGFGAHPCIEESIDFKYVYDEAKLTGLVFEELYRWDEG